MESDTAPLKFILSVFWEGAIGFVLLMANFPFLFNTIHGKLWS